MFKSGLGSCGIAWLVSGNVEPRVTRFQLPGATAELIAADPKGEKPVQAKTVPDRIKMVIERVQRHLGGEPQDFADVAVELAGFTPFSRAVYAAARKIPPGKTMTYGEVAGKIKRPKAARAVGQALARNPIPLIIPCHRVLAAGGSPGGFSAPGGLATKASMLAGEGVLLPG